MITSEHPSANSIEEEEHPSSIQNQAFYQQIAEQKQIKIIKNKFLINFSIVNGFFGTSSEFFKLLSISNNNIEDLNFLQTQSNQHIFLFSECNELRKLYNF